MGGEAGEGHWGDCCRTHLQVGVFLHRFWIMMFIFAGVGGSVSWSFSSYFFSGWFPL